MMLFHVPHGYTFADLLADACDYWGVPRNRFCLKDPETKMLWPLHRVRARAGRWGEPQRLFPHPLARS